MKILRENLLKMPRSIYENPPLCEEIKDIWSDEEVVQHQAEILEYPKWKKHKLCRPSCIPISIICVMIFLVVLLPVLDQTTEKALQELNKKRVHPAMKCDSNCSFALVETIPIGLSYKNNSIQFNSTYSTWMDLIQNAEKSIEIASFYWTMQSSEVYPDSSSNLGQEIFDEILNAGVNRNIKIRIAQNMPTKQQPNIDTEYLVKKKAAEVRSLNFAKIIGAGVLHTKLWIIDRKHVYIGSANMDWRSLSQVKELGIYITNCSCIGEDVGKIFDVYWSLGESQSVPSKWPVEYSTDFNIENPMNVTINAENFHVFLTSSPAQFNPAGRENDINGLVNVIKNAEKFIYVAVMDYFPLTIYTPKLQFWGVIDDALKSALINEKVNVKLLISEWAHSRIFENNFLKSLVSLSAFKKGAATIEVRRFVVPVNGSQIPFARVNHNKYMVTDNSMFVGTSNWSGDYFINTAGVSFVLQEENFGKNSSRVTLRKQLQDIFERDWNSEYAHQMN